MWDCYRASVGAWSAGVSKAATGFGAGKPIWVTEEHHHVLKGWTELRRDLASRGMSQPPALITFDFHTDLHEPFNRDFFKIMQQDMKLTPEQYEAYRSQRLGSMHFQVQSSIDAAIPRMCHDEHIVAAHRTDIIGNAYVFLGTWQSQKSAYDWVTIYDGNYLPGNATRGSDAGRLRYAKMVISDELLEKPVAELETRAAKKLEDLTYILDIDLDVFQTELALSPGGKEIFYRLIRHAAGISIAMEPECVLRGKIKSQTITAESLLSNIFWHLEEALGEGSITPRPDIEAPAPPKFKKKPISEKAKGL